MIDRDNDTLKVKHNNNCLEEQPDATNTQNAGNKDFSAQNQKESSPNIQPDAKQVANLKANSKNVDKSNTHVTKRRMASSAKKIALLAVFTALSLIMFLIESLFPSLLLPGAKMGLANIFSFAALILYGPFEAFVVVIARTLLGAMFAGNFSSLLFSFTGGIVSMAVSSVLVYAVYPRISIFSISIVAAICHNITQNLVYIILYQTPIMFKYMPYLALIGILSGTIVGGVTWLLFKKVPLSVYEKALFK
jgi:heptaprenyl diphosphate synthase